MKHDAIDSLIYLTRGLPLDWAIETIQDRFGREDECHETQDIVSVLESAISAIRHEAGLHYDGRSEYSNGVQFERVYKFASSEPGDGGGEVPVIMESHLQMNPGKPLLGPPDGGVWKD